MRAAEIAEEGAFIHQTALIDSNVADAPSRSSAPTVRRLAWRTRYIIGLVTLDFLIGLGAAVAAFTLRFGVAEDGPNKQAYILVTCLLPFAWLVSLATNRAYEPRRLFVGNDEYERVLRSGLGLTAALAIAAFSFDYRLARGYLIIAVPLATLAGVCGRYVVRQRLHRQWGRGERLTRVILVGHEQAVLETTRRLRRERYHGLGVVGACLPATASSAPGYHRASPGLPPVYGNFEKVAQAVSRAEADTVIVLSCPEIDGAAVRRLAWQLERNEIDLIVAS